MGEDDMAVVDSQLRVRGLHGLRVIDSSVFPSEPNGNLNAPTIMLAERASDLVRGRTPLAAADVPVGLVGDWEQQQRSHAPARQVV
jgi:choline dehydrogenase